MLNLKKQKNILKPHWALALIAFVVMTVTPVTAFATSDSSKTDSAASPTTTSTDPCKDTTVNNGVQSCVTQTPIIKDIQTIVDFLSGTVGVVVVAVIIMGGIQYSMAGDNPSAVTAAKQRITNGLIALVAFFLVYALLQWLIPGGVFK